MSARRSSSVSQAYAPRGWCRGARVPRGRPPIPRASPRRGEVLRAPWWRSEWGEVFSQTLGFGCLFDDAPGVGGVMADVLLGLGPADGRDVGRAPGRCPSRVGGKEGAWTSSAGGGALALAHVLGDEVPRLVPRTRCGVCRSWCASGAPCGPDRRARPLVTAARASRCASPCRTAAPSGRGCAGPPSDEPRGRAASGAYSGQDPHHLGVDAALRVALAPRPRPASMRRAMRSYDTFGEVAQVEPVHEASRRHHVRVRAVRVGPRSSPRRARGSG